MDNKLNDKNIIEALIFVSGEPVSFDKIQKSLSARGGSPPVGGSARGLAPEGGKISKGEVRKIIDELVENYSERGVNILEFENKIEMVTSADVANSISEFVKSELQEDLSQAALETLAIIAYRGPVSRAQIEDIRGVNCTFILRNLLIRGLVKRENNPEDARSYIYSITADFFKKLGLKSIEELPEYDKYATSV